MDASFWHRRWTKNEIGFHLEEVNPLLLDYFKVLGLAREQRIFVPLCGKTRDIAWLLDQGFAVLGCELNQSAVEQLFDELGVNPEVQQLGDQQLFSAPNIDIWCGDMFTLNAEQLGQIDAVYDRAALVALPEQMRFNYVAKLLELANNAPQLLVTLEYDQSLQAGPPFSLSDAEINQHYQSAYKIERLLDQPVAGGLKGKSPAQEKVWHLSVKTLTC